MGALEYAAAALIAVLLYVIVWPIICAASIGTVAKLMFERNHKRMLKQRARKPT